MSGLRSGAGIAPAGFFLVGMAQVFKVVDELTTHFHKRIRPYGRNQGRNDLVIDVRLGAPVGHIGNPANTEMNHFNVCTWVD